MFNVIKSISDNEDEIINNILKLYNDNRPFDVDTCYSKGSFYKSGRVPEPLRKFDLSPISNLYNDIMQADVRSLPLSDESITSIVFDPPFMFKKKEHAKKNPAAIRFTIFDTFEELEDVYRGALKEFQRILKPKGIVAFKCQDFTDSKNHMLHCMVYNWATEYKFETEDLFIRYRHHGPVYNPNVKQKHARKFHSYWFVFRKK